MPPQQKNRDESPIDTVGEASQYLPTQIGMDLSLFHSTVGSVSKVDGRVEKQLAHASRKRIADRQASIFIPKSPGANQLWGDLPEPQFGVKGTPSEKHLSANWYDHYLHHVTEGRKYRFVRLQNVIRGKTLERLRQFTKEFPQVLQSPVIICEYMEQSVFGSIFPNNDSPSGFEIEINGRIAHCPNDIIFMIVEEAIHIVQELQGFPFDYASPYEERSHEKLAKAAAGGITGLPERSA